MKIRLFTPGLVMIATIIALSGCQTDSAQRIKRAQLIGQENLQLKKQLQQKDQEIADLKKEIDRINAEYAQFQEDNGKSSMKLLEMLAESQTRLAKYEGNGDDPNTHPALTVPPARTAGQ